MARGIRLGTGSMLALVYLLASPPGALARDRSHRIVYDAPELTPAQWRHRASGYDVVASGVVTGTGRIGPTRPCCPCEMSMGLSPTSTITLRIERRYKGVTADTLTFYTLFSARPEVGSRITMCASFFAFDRWRLFGVAIPEGDPRLPLGRLKKARARDRRLARSFKRVSSVVLVRVLEQMTPGWTNHVYRVEPIEWLGPARNQAPTMIKIESSRDCISDRFVIGDTVAVPVSSKGAPRLVKLKGCPSLYKIFCGIIAGTQVDVAVASQTTSDGVIRLWPQYQAAH